MILHADRRALLSHAAKTARAAGGRYTPGGFSGLLVEADGRTNLIRMTATNAAVTIQTVLPATIDRGGSYVIDARRFTHFLEKMPEDDIYMELKGNGLLYMGRPGLEYHFAVMPGDIFPLPDLSFPAKTAAAKGLKALISKAAFAAAPDSERALFSCLRLVLSESGLYALGINNRCVIEVRGDPECKGNLTVHVPAESLRVLAAIASNGDVFSLGVTESNGSKRSIVFTDGSTLLSARLVEGEGVNTEQLFALAAPEISVKLCAEGLRTALEQLMSVYLPEDTVSLRAKEDGLELACDTDQGACVLHVRASADRILNQQYYFTLRYLLGCAKSLAGDITLCLSNNKTLTVYGRDIRYLQAGVLPPKKAKPKAAA